MFSLVGSQEYFGIIGTQGENARACWAAYRGLSPLLQRFTFALGLFPLIIAG